MMLKTYQYVFQLQMLINIIGQERSISTNGSYIYKNTTLTINILETITMAKNRLFVSVYRNIIGFFANVSFTVSVYLLTVSGIDRLQALLNHFIIIKMLLKPWNFKFNCLLVVGNLCFTLTNFCHRFFL